MLAIPALLGEHVTGPYEGQPKPPLEVVVVTFDLYTQEQIQKPGRRVLRRSGSAAVQHPSLL